MLDVIKVNKSYKEPALFSNKKQHILKDVSFKMSERECKSIIGESGSGKSTLMRMVLGIEKPDNGEVLLNGKSILKAENRKGVISAVFQDYLASMNPNRTVRQNLSEPLKALNLNFEDDVLAELLYKVNLPKEYLSKYPHELSGGEGQRVCIARAISTKPKLLVLDEAVSSLDVSVQVKILDLLLRIKEECDMAYLFVTHDIQAATYISDNIIIFNEGRIVEELQVKDIASAKSEYTQQLFNSVITV
ncbi:MAG: ABC transporter ATP-binding protein [Eubacteriales bacterium]